ncbi:MAG: hypothetical protein R3309_12355 [Reinekea sp.]|nr:hypothetical protein [Reinekea sp.]
MALSEKSDLIKTTATDEQEEKKLDIVGSFCPNEECPDNGKVQNEQQTNIIKYGKLKSGRQRFKCKTCQRTFS